MQLLCKMLDKLCRMQPESSQNTEPVQVLMLNNCQHASDL